MSTKLVSPHAREDYLARNVHDESTYRVWQRRFYDFNIWSEKKRLEKLDTMHGNPVQQGLVKIPAHWPWSSWRFYHLNDTSVLAMDRDIAAPHVCATRQIPRREQTHADAT